MQVQDFTAAWSPRILSVLRIMTALLLLQYGMAKLLGFPKAEYFANLAAFSLSWFAGVLELVGGALLLLGLFTRPVAFVLSGLMAFAYFLGHAPKGFFPLLNGGTLAVLLCFVFLYFASAGGGAWSADSLLRSKPAGRPAGAVSQRA
jgi:putative oxidoreductase